MDSVNCCDESAPLLTLAEALQRALQMIEPLTATESVALLDADGRILAADLKATLDAPPHDVSAMDGFALSLADLAAAAPTRLPVSGQSLAGHPYTERLAPQTAVRITTGAFVPTGADAVIMQEHCQVDAAQTTISIDLQTATRLKLGENIRRHGEDIQSGTCLLNQGLRLRPQDVALAAGQGLTHLPVQRRLRVAVASTGDELHEPGAPLPDGAIYESNRYALIALLGRLGCAVTDLGILEDQRATLHRELGRAAETHDVLITSGGVSVGTADFVKEVIAELGQIAFWRLAVKPGKPIAFGKIGDCLSFGLPGNPVSVIVSFLMFARPLLLKRMGSMPSHPLRLRVPAAFTCKRKAGRREWLRARLQGDDPTQLRVNTYPHNSSAALLSLSWADGLVELSESCNSVAEGDLVDYLPFSGFGIA